MDRYIGIEVHKNQSQICIVQGDRVVEQRINMSRLVFAPTFGDCPRSRMCEHRLRRADLAPSGKLIASPMSSATFEDIFQCERLWCERGPNSSRWPSRCCAGSGVCHAQSRCSHLGLEELGAPGDGTSRNTPGDLILSVAVVRPALIVDVAEPLRHSAQHVRQPGFHIGQLGLEVGLGDDEQHRRSIL